jgi:hypothetical protein
LTRVSQVARVANSRLKYYKWAAIISSANDVVKRPRPTL